MKSIEESLHDLLGMYSKVTIPIKTLKDLLQVEQAELWHEIRKLKRASNSRMLLQKVKNNPHDQDDFSVEISRR